MNLGNSQHTLKQDMQQQGPLSGPRSSDTQLCQPFYRAVPSMGTLRRHLQGMFFPVIHFLSPDMGCFYHLAHPTLSLRVLDGAHSLCHPASSILPSESGSKLLPASGGLIFLLQGRHSSVLKPIFSTMAQHTSLRSDPQASLQTQRRDLLGK